MGKLYQLSKMGILGRLVKPYQNEYTESELILPALHILAQSKCPVSTSALIQSLQKMLKPKGHDATIITGRQDSYFSQKVRNLKSHNSLTKLKLAKYTDGYWQITNAGQSFLKTNEVVVQTVVDQGFSTSNLSQRKIYDYSKLVIEEGRMAVQQTTIRKRSARLKTAAVAAFKKQHEGKVFCIACKFCFAEKYGKHGKDYIEVHHMSPIYEKDIKGEKATMATLLLKVSLVCANCHRMIHRKQTNMLTINQLRKLLQ